VVSNPNVQSQGSPPATGGYRSYASLIQERLIYGRFYAGWSVTQGRYTFQPIYSPEFNADRYHSQRMPIGYEMIENSFQRYRNYTRQETPNDAWVLRTYLDGTALYRKWKVRSLRYNCYSKIDRTLEFFYYKEGEVQEGRYNKVQVLRRKHLNPQFITPTDAGFGEFLQHKYNHRGA
jgi:hypothetical protein